MSILLKKSFKLAVRIVHISETLNCKKKFVISRQLLRSGTSVGANIREAFSAQSDKDFIHKLYIALKEARETSYWIELLQVSFEYNLSIVNSLTNEIQALLVSTIKTKKKNMN